MIFYKTEDEIQLMRESADILGRAHAEVAKVMKPGVKTIELDRIAEITTTLTISVNIAPIIPINPPINTYNRNTEYLL